MPSIVVRKCGCLARSVMPFTAAVYREKSRPSARRVRERKPRVFSHSAQNAHNRCTLSVWRTASASPRGGSFTAAAMDRLMWTGSTMCRRSRLKLYPEHQTQSYVAMTRANPVSDFLGKAVGVLVVGFFVTVYMMNKQHRREQMNATATLPTVTGKVGTLHPPGRAESRLCEPVADGGFAAPCTSYGAYVWQNTPAEVARACGGRASCWVALEGWTTNRYHDGSRVWRTGFSVWLLRITIRDHYDSQCGGRVSGNSGVWRKGFFHRATIASGANRPTTCAKKRIQATLFRPKPGLPSRTIETAAR